MGTLEAIGFTLAVLFFAGLVSLEKGLLWVPVTFGLIALVVAGLGR